MSVYDRWHTKRPRHDSNGDLLERCKEHKQYPSSEHGSGDRWQVRWRDENKKQCKRNFPKKSGNDPEVCADAFNAKISAELNSGTYVDPAAGKISLEAYAKQWRAGLIGDPNTTRNIDERLTHIYDVEIPRNEHTRRKGGASKSPIGPLAMSLLAKRPSLIQQWIKGLEDKGLWPELNKIR